MLTEISCQATIEYGFRHRSTVRRIITGECTKRACLAAPPLVSGRVISKRRAISNSHASLASRRASVGDVKTASLGALMFHARDIGASSYFIGH